MKTIFTVNEVAKLCDVAPRTVKKWFDSGRLQGYRIPVSQDRRIPRESLIRYLRENGMSLGKLENKPISILLVGSNNETRARLSEKLEVKDEFKIDVASSDFKVRVAMDGNTPNFVVIDFAMGRDEAVFIAQRIRRVPRFNSTIIIFLVSKEDIDVGFDDSICVEAFVKPLDDIKVTNLVERIGVLIDG